VRLNNEIACVVLSVPPLDLKVPPPATACCGPIWIFEGGSFIFTRKRWVWKGGFPHFLLKAENYGRGVVKR